MYKKDAKPFGPWDQFSLEKDLKLVGERHGSPKRIYFVSFRNSLQKFRIYHFPSREGIKGCVRHIQMDVFSRLMYSNKHPSPLSRGETCISKQIPKIVNKFDKTITLILNSLKRGKTRDFLPIFYPNRHILGYKWRVLFLFLEAIFTSSSTYLLPEMFF